jgi:uncharacterized membrane protein YozB (DUF420 family)
MRAQRRFAAAAALALAIFVVGAVTYLFLQPTEDAMEGAAIVVFALMGLLITVVILAAVAVRKTTGARWPEEEVLRKAGERPGRPGPGGH